MTIEDRRRWKIPERQIVTSVVLADQMWVQTEVLSTGWR